MKDKENDLSKEEVAKLSAYKASLDNATKFIRCGSRWSSRSRSDWAP
jgi:hypothetical protein